jgi:hypothetical protein
VIYGPDVSHYQGAFDHRRARSEGMDFLIAKVSQGSGMRDSRWPYNRDGARAAGLLVCGYHYIDTSPPAAQARNCAGWLGDLNIPIALDHERGGGDVNQLRVVLNTFRAQGMRVALTYCPPFYWREIGSPSLAGLPPLWKARYFTTGGTPQQLYAKTPANYWDGYGGLNPVMLQFTDGASLAGQRVDANAFRGTRAELAALFGSGGGGVVTAEEFLMALSDAEQREVLGAVRNLNFQLVRGDGPDTDWGWQTWPGGTNERLTLIDFARRSNERVEALVRAVAALASQVSAGGGGGGGGGVDAARVEQVIRESFKAADLRIVPGDPA